jgi:mannose-1-phosphate guanylyltransferase
MRTKKAGTTRKGGAKSNRYIVIMAGGRGERFWPVSREATPKQLITLLAGGSFLQQAVERVRSVVPDANIFVITNKAQAAAVRRQLPHLPKDNIVAEPMGRDTCAAVALGAAVVAARNPAGLMAVLPADHVIPDARTFAKTLSDAFAAAGSNKVIVTIGIKPTAPETGYGYIQGGPALTVTVGGKPAATAFFKAERFVEKPNLETAQKYLEAGTFRWNAGMFLWSVETIREALGRHQPALLDAFQRWSDAFAKSSAKLHSLLAKDYPGLQKISVDYALLEKADNVVMADGAFDWDDLGAWPALARHLPPDAGGNTASADFVQVDAQRNVVFDARTKGRRGVIALVGLKDSIVVLTDDATLVASKAEAQRIKELVKGLGADPARKKLV